MRTAKGLLLVFVTAPGLRVARRLARGALREKLVACANLLPGVESHYWWQGKVASSAEALILFKTTRRKIPALERFILRSHPYDTPEFVVVAMNSGTSRYLDWLTASVK